MSIYGRGHTGNSGRRVPYGNWWPKVGELVRIFGTNIVGEVMKIDRIEIRMPGYENILRDDIYLRLMDGSEKIVEVHDLEQIDGLSALGAQAE